MSLKHQVDTDPVSIRLPNRPLKDAGRFGVWTHRPDRAHRLSWSWLEALRTHQWAREWPQGQRK